MLKSLSELFKKDYPAGNCAALLDEKELSDIACKVKYDYEQDLTTCEKKFEELEKIMDLAMIVSQQKSYPWPNSSNIIYPLIANAAINFGAACYPEIIQDNEVVKAKIIGKDSGKIAKFNGEIKLGEDGEPVRQGAGEKLKRGNRVATMMNWQFLEQMDWWETDIDKEVHILPIVGTLYKKVYYDPIKKMPVSELIFPNRIVINNGARDIDSATVTQLIELYPQEILERIRSEFYVNFDFDITDAMNSDSSNDADAQANIPMFKRTDQDPTINSNLHLFLEQHTWRDLDEDGFLEPYIVTVHYNSGKCVRIVPRFAEKDIVYNKQKEIQEIKARKYFVVRRFLPSFDGSFLGIGFGHLLFNISNGINATINQMIDAGHLSITGGGFVAKNVKVRGGKLVLSPNEYKMLDVMAGDLASSFYSPPRPEPSAVLFTLLGSMIDTGKELASMRDVLNGDVAANVAPTTMMSLVEQGMKQFKSIYKRYYKSLKTEFSLVYDINAEYLSNEEYAKVLDEDEMEVDKEKDFEKYGYDIVPVADVNAVNSAQKFAQANFLSGFLNDPYVDGFKLRKQIFNIAKITDTDELVIRPTPQQDPALEIEQMRSQIKMQEINIKAQQTMSMIESAKADMAKKMIEIEKIRSEVMVNFANVGKISKETDYTEQREQVKVLDNIIDAQVRQQEMALRSKESDMSHAIEIAKLEQDTMKHLTKIQHEKDQTISQATD